MNARQRQLGIEMLRQPTHTAAAIAAGYSPGRAPQVVGDALRTNESFRAYWRGLLAQAGLDEASMAAKISAGTEAMQYGLSRDGVAVEMGPDWHARAKLLDMAAKISDAYPNQRLDIRAQVAGAVVVLRESDALAASDPYAAAIEGQSEGPP